MKDFYEYVNKNDGKVGTKTRGIDLNFNNACNLRCKYCFTNSPKGDHVKEYLDYKAIAKLADVRAENGAEQNRLNVATELLMQNQTNLEAAHGRIVDADMALESTRMARQNVLVQSSAAMLAQANQLTGIILQVLG